MTVLHQAGFGTNNFSQWTSTDIDVGCTLETSTARPHHGRIGAHCITAAGGGVVARCSQDVSGNTTLYGRCYVNFASLPTVDGDFVGVIAFLYDDYNWLAKLGVAQIGTDVLFYLEAFATSNTFIRPFFLNKGYCMELKVVANDAVNGEARGYIDGVERVRLTGQDTSYGTAGHVLMGIVDTYTSGFENYIDCCITGDKYNGPEKHYPDARKNSNMGKKRTMYPKMGRIVY